MRADSFNGLHVLADDDPRWPLDPVAQATAACNGGAHVVQLRAKHATDTTTLEWARTIREITRAAGTRFIVNDRFDIALLADADGVHLGQSDIPPLRIPADARARLCIGRSTHNEEQARTATKEGVDYIAFGPVFGTTSKDSEYDSRGLAALASVVSVATPVPVVAIGGIDLARIHDVRRAGASGFAVISAVVEASDPVAATRALVEQCEAEGST